MNRCLCLFAVAVVGVVGCDPVVVDGRDRDDDDVDDEVDVDGDACTTSIEGQGPSIDNIDDGAVFHHNLAIVNGTAVGDHVVVDGADGERSWPVVGGRYRALVPLVDGDNCIGVVDDTGSRGVVVRYETDSNGRFVRTVWLDAVDGDGAFDAEAGEDNDATSAHRRLSTTMWLLQAFTAETMHEAGYGRRTFKLALADGDDGVRRPFVEDVTSPITTAEAEASDGNTLWSRLYTDLDGLALRNDSIDVVVMAMTRYDASTQTALSHTALGGGRLALFGSGTLQAHAEDLDGVVAAFEDARVVDTSELFDDSAFRGTHWANYATGAGAMLHELGHCLSLPHPAAGVSVMGRGFDHVNRKLVIEEPASATSSALSPIAPGDEVGFDPSHLVRLAYHPWLAQNDDRSDATLDLRLSDDSATVVVDSAAGVRQVEYQLDGNSVGFVAFEDDAPTSTTITLADVRAEFGAGVLRLLAIDDDGNIAGLDAPDAL